jgi:alkanesulfonate monooxygenase SsuD/methylene tetrahydromethanopterin reductase-like flavin-dependent oxidoreductase (luciferase family)
VNFSLTLYGVPPRDYPELCHHAEDLGFSRAWIGDHVVIPWEAERLFPGRLQPALEPNSPNHFDTWVMIGAVLAATSTLEVASGINVLPLRPALVQARAAATAAVVSGGRFRFAVGVGWIREEYEWLGVAWPRRGKRFDEMIDILELAFAGGPFEYHGEFHDFGLVQVSGDPIEVPLLFGGGESPAGLARAARRGNGFFFGFVSDALEKCVSARNRIDALRVREGRQGAFEYTVRIPGAPTRDLVERYREAGFENLAVPGVLLGGEHASLATRKNALERIAREFELSG